MNKILAIFALIMGIAFTMNAQNLITYTQYRFTVDEYGEMYPKTDKDAECYARIEVYDSLQCIKIFTKKYGNATIYYDSLDVVSVDDDIRVNYYKNNTKVAIVMVDYDYNFEYLFYFRKSSLIIYSK